MNEQLPSGLRAKSARPLTVPEKLCRRVGELPRAASYSQAELLRPAEQEAMQRHCVGVQRAAERQVGGLPPMASTISTYSIPAAFGRPRPARIPIQVERQNP